MAIQVQHRRGTLAENAAFTGAAGELVYITDTDQIAIHDGVTAGGFIIPNELDIVNDYFGYATATGTNTIALTVLSNISAYAAGQTFTFKAANTITGAATLNVNSLGALTIKKPNTSGPSIDAVGQDDIIQNGIYTVRVIDGSNCQLMNAAGGSGDWELLATDTADSDSSIDFTDVITADHIDYRLCFDQMHPSVDGSDAYFRTDVSNGASFDTVNYDSYEIGVSGNVASISYTGVTSAILLNASAPSGTIGNAAGEGITGEIILHAPFNGGMFKAFSWRAIHRMQSGGSPWAVISGIGVKESTGAINACQLLFDSGNVVTGDFYFWGMRAS